MASAGILGDEVSNGQDNFITGFKFSWSWNQLEMPAPPVRIVAYNAVTAIADKAAEALAARAA